MSAHAHQYDSLPTVGEFRPAKVQAIGLVLAGLGLFSFAALFMGGPSRAFAGLLQAMLVPLLIGLGALFYISVHSLTNAVWMQPLRRLMEALSLGVPIAALFYVVLALVGAPYLYDWVAQSGADHARLFHVHGGSKSHLMVWWRYLLTNTLIFVAWIALRHQLVRLSVAQDHGADVTAQHRRWSIIFLLVFAPTFTLFIWDHLLALHVNWFSTMWGVYVFSSAVQTFLCVLILLVLWLRRGPLKPHINQDCLHDLGTWMIAWSCFCAYIGFSQFMLIYYANLDEETYYYVMRTQNGYGLHYVIETLLRWPLPFLGLMSQSLRTRPWVLGVISAAVLLGNWLDWSWMIMPAFAPNHYQWPFGFELLLGLGAAGLLLWAVCAFFKKRGLLASGEPTLLASINADHRH